MFDNTLKIDTINITLDLNEINKQLNIDKNDIAFLAGSLIESMVTESSKNMGNSLSDIDIFIITDNIENYEVISSDYTKSLHKILFRKINGINIDIEIYDKKIILDLIKQLNSYNSEKIDSKIYNIIKLPYELRLNKFTSFLHRLINSVPLCNIESYNNFKNIIDLDKYYKFMTRFSVNEVENMFDDIIGNLESKEYTVALILARDMLLESVGAYIFYNKESIDRKKWIVLKFRNISHRNTHIKNLYDRFLELNFSTVIKEDKEFRKNIQGIIKFSNILIAEISDNGGL